MSSSDNEVDLMRRALGLRGPVVPSEGSPQPNIGPHSPRHDMERRTRRFVRDGEVPVVVLSRTRDPALPGAAPSNRLVAAETALSAERALRERAERSLHEAQETIQHLQTQLGHANLAHSEALAAERLHREQAERSLSEALAARAELELRQVMQPAQPAPPPPAPAPLPVPRPVVEPIALAPRKRMKATAVEREAQPVKWWLAAGKTKARKA